MGYTRNGYSDKVQNVKYLDEIFDMIKNSVKIQEIGFRKYLVYDDSLLDKEKVKEYQKKLSKKWYSFQNYNYNHGMYNSLLTKKEYEKELVEWERKRKEEEEYWKKIEKRNKCIGGVYGIYYEDQLIYIGKTKNDFEIRFQQHKEAINNKETNQYLYKYLSQKDCSKLEFKPLIEVEKLKVKQKIRNRDIEAMELCLIELYQPICNVQGRLQEYEFSGF